jgi:hypothetical protein
VRRARSKLLWLAAFVSSAVLAAACGSFGSNDGDTNAAPPDGSVGDGSSADGSSGDGGPPDDGSTGADAHCTDLFVDSFDSLQNFTPSSDNEGDAGLDKAHVTSPPTSLLATVTVDQFGGDETLDRSFPLDGGLGARALELAFNVYFDTSAPAYAETGCTLELLDSAGATTRFLYAHNSDTSLELKVDAVDDAGTAIADASPSADLAPTSNSEWQHVLLTVLPSGQGRVHVISGVAPAGTANAQLDGVVIPVGVDHARIRCGVDFAGAKDGSADVSAWIDDVHVRRCSP